MNHASPHSSRHPLPSFLLCVLCVCVVSPSARSAGPEYNRDIRPILAENCFACHGPDSAARKAGLRLDIRDEAVKAGAIVPGNPDSSALIERINSSDPKEQMPPRKSLKKLTPAQKQTLKQWVAGGAEYQLHWSFLAARRPALPQVKNKAWARNAIDHFILAELEKKGLQPAPEADRRTLARRLSLDLTGLPPRPEDVEEFVNDKAANAYEQPGRKAPQVASVGRAPRPALARCRSLCRYPRHPLRQLPRDLLVPRLGHQRLQPQHALRPVHHRTVGRRPAARSHPRSEGGDRLQPLQHHLQRGRPDPRGVPGAVHAGSDRDDRPGVDGADRRLCGLPRSQVRPNHRARLLFPGRVLQQHHPGSDGRQHLQYSSCPRCAAHRGSAALGAVDHPNAGCPHPSGSTQEGSPPRVRALAYVSQPRGDRQTGPNREAGAARPTERGQGQDDQPGRRGQAQSGDPGTDDQLERRQDRSQGVWSA